MAESLCRLMVFVASRSKAMKKPRQRVLRAFGQSVRKRRQALGLSQEKLAELADLHRTYIADIERGTRNVGLINVVRLAEALDVSPGTLVDPLAKRANTGT